MLQDQHESHRIIKSIYFHPSFNVTDQINSSLSQQQLICHKCCVEKKSIMSHINICITEAVGCEISIVQPVMVKLTFYFIVSHDSNVITHCQNIYTIETKQVFTCVRYVN